MSESKGQPGRTIFVGDVHGCLRELEAMVDLLQPTEQDRVIMLGDLINRGPDSVGCVLFVHRAGFECLLGNHEADYLARHRSAPHYRDLHKALGPVVHDWIDQLPLYIEEENFLAVHAGLQPGKHPEGTKAAILTHIRTWDGQGHDLKSSDNPPWYDFYQDQRPVFYGHWARAGLRVRHNTIGLDSGCVYGRRLSACILEEDRRIVQVPAARRYYIAPSLRARVRRLAGGDGPISG